jgi:hypothetical protein
MARYSRIHLGPARKNDPQVREAIANAAITPGCLIVLSSGKFALAGATTVGKVWIAQENYLAQQGVDVAYAQDVDTVLGLEMQDDTMYAARVATGVNITAVGTPLTPGANGTLAIAAASDLVVAYSDEIYNNNTGSTQLVRVRPAASASYLSAA